ncbi:RagB/SusD family nutrient uptake outer membrane protein [Segetibacter sp.]|jgi:hypothetical protein|uniref:RagB/SusD family nutrient uptake outer membrane protein n=1 Tax=Segetibacter sp. TaxID=2231182 RepID=UPI00260EF60B|nr:RagB/SusD family nutrient uptake outer membrane protein [Segetibacter sp.]MCW3082393.1 putative nutrient binding outer membrane protein [Segetibacter sp.]
MKCNYKRVPLLKIYFGCVATLVIVFSTGCTKFLEETPTGSMTNQTTFTTAQDGAALTIGPYRSLPGWVGGAGDWGNYLPAVMEYPTGKAFTTTTHVQFWKFQTNQVSGDLLDDYNNSWNNWYQGVRDCNFSISKISEIAGMSPDEKSRSLGEVRTLRAWYYFCLVRYFGDVVMDTTTLTNLSEAQKPRTSLKTIYDNIIIPDLEFAVHNSSLTDAKSGNGRVTKLIARAILSDVYLTCAGYPYQEVATDPARNWCVGGLFSQQEYPVNTTGARAFLKKAQEQLNALYGRYTLGTYADLRSPEMNNKGEAIFQAQFLAGVTDNQVVAASLPSLSRISMFGDEYGTFIPSLGYYNSYNPADKRIQDRQMFYSSDTKSKKYDPSEGPADKFARPYLFKFYDSAAIKVTGRSSLNWSFYRYADILLMLTEVNWTLRQLGDAATDDDIIKGINEVRARAGLPTYRASNVNLLTIMSERAYELVFENKMLWDQRRTRMCLVDGIGQFSAIERFIGHRPQGFSFAFGVQNLLSPIAGREIINNSKVLQNFSFLPKQVGQ